MDVKEEKGKGRNNLTVLWVLTCDHTTDEKLRFRKAFKANRGHEVIELWWLNASLCIIRGDKSARPRTAEAEAPCRQGVVSPTQNPPEDKDRGLPTPRAQRSSLMLDRDLGVIMNEETNHFNLESMTTPKSEERGDL